MEDLLNRLLAGGGELADVFFEDRVARMVEGEDGGLERITTAREAGVGMRIVRDGVTSFATSVDLRPKTLIDLARYIASGSKKGKGVTISGLRSQPPGALVVEEDLSATPLEDEGRMVMDSLQAARALDARIVQVKSVCRDSSAHVVIANSLGIYAEDRRSHGVFLVQVVASDGQNMQVGYEPRGGTGGVEVFASIDPEDVAVTAARRAVTILEAPEAPAGPMTVVLTAEAGGTMIHEAVGHGLEADLTGQGLSVYSGRIGEKVASDLVTVVDDPTLPGRRGSYNFDDEGVAARRTVLVENGVLRTYMNDLVTARRDGVEPTGNGRRQSFRHWPIPRMSNTIILPGRDDPESIVRSVQSGLLVRKMGGGQVNTVTGDFVFEVSEGYLIRGGEVAGPVRGATLAGNGPEVLRSVDMLGSDLGFGLGTCGKEGQGVPVGDAQPTLRLPEIVVGGRDSGGHSG
ncbi:MAG: TldD/PmbA family protein [bacterium]|nr:MAG: TldD/PmbA family protein [bacterium]